MTVAATDAAAAPGWARFVGDFHRPPEHSVAFRVATLLAAVVAVAAVAANDVGGPGLWFIGLAVIPVGGLVSYRRRASTNPVWPAILTLVTIALAVRFVLTHGSVSAPGELRLPLAELLVALEGVRSYALRSRRDLRFALAASMALMALAGSLSLSIQFAVFLGVWGLCAAASLTLCHRSELVDVAGTPTSDGRRLSRGSTRTVVTAALGVAIAAIVAFMVVPAARSSRLLAFTSNIPDQVRVPNPGELSNPSLGDQNPSRPGSDESGDSRQSFGYFGFSNELDTSIRGRPDDTLVLRVRSSAPDFWRGQTFDLWDGRRWRISDERTAVLTGRSPIEVLNPFGEGPALGDELVQTFYLETSGPNVIFAANRPTHVYIPQSSLFELTDGTVRTGVELDQGAAYTVVSRRAPSTATGLQLVGDVREGTPQQILTRYAQPPVITPRVRDLATRLAAGSGSTYDVVRSMETWMGRNTQYSLDIPPLDDGADAVDTFLFDDRKGFCEQIASSLVVMLRSQGIPARLAVGYTPGERNPFTGLYEVRAKDAHAWTEVYFPGYGWQSFDPTAAVPFAGDPQTDAARAGLKDYLAKHLPDLSAPILGAIAAAALILVAVALRRRIVAAFAWLSGRRRRPWSVRQLDRLDAIGAKLGRGRDTTETAQEYAAALNRTVLRDPRLVSVADALAADAFSEAELDEHARAEVERLIDAIAERV